jgi:predicted ATPase
VTTKIVSEIREESLILYDEPETHLHPNAISDLMTALARLLDRFNSFSIIATHSPLVIRELHPNNVIVLRRIEDGLEAAPLSIDSFGQNLTIIIEQIFGNKEVNKLHLERIKTLVQERRSFNEIISILQDREIPVNLNTRLFLSSLIDDQNEESAAL